jgi:hypothetical protein
LLTGDPGIRFKDLADASAQLLKGVSHSLPPSCWPRFVRGSPALCNDWRTESNPLIRIGYTSAIGCFCEEKLQPIRVFG